MVHLCFLLGLIVCVGARPNIETYGIELTASSGYITSEGYPGSYTSADANSWRLRVPGAQSFTIYFEDVDLDKNGCYDYITLYDDDDYSAPGNFYCESPASGIHVMRSSKMTVSFSTGSDYFTTRGRGFRIKYVAEGNVIPTIPPVTDPVSTTTTAAITNPTPTVTDPQPTTYVGQPATSSVDVTTTGPVVTTTTASKTTTIGVPAGGEFPPGGQDDSKCGLPVTEPIISNFDYKSQGEAVSRSNFPSARVVNGETAVPHSWPWQVSLQGSYGSAYCGGTLVREQWVVTAAHCAALIFIGTYGSDQVALGYHDKQRSTEPGRQLIDIVQKIVHPRYDTPDRSHDVALVRMKTPAILSDTVNLACEAHAGWEFPAGMECVVTGWGVTVEGGNRGTNILQQAPLPLLSDQACYDLYQQANLDTTQDMQCAGGSGKGACNGDSGGPLNCYVNNRWYHMGIVSFGEASCDTEIAGVFARVAELRDFIDLHLPPV